MNTDPDLPDVSLYSSASSKVTSVSGVKPLKGYADSDAEKKRQRRTTETDFRKRLSEAIGVLQAREARHSLDFDLVELDGELAVSIANAAGERIGLMPAEEAVDRAETGDETAFFVNREC
ncbi:hypothetical protein [Endozoicomonas montiporae]|nr:hypothetical protein [Endozoicomonas montiporae]AMO56399.1 putative acyl carrier protein [Endozoicomonas montiporae CL-33]